MKFFFIFINFAKHILFIIYMKKTEQKNILKLYILFNFFF